MAAKEVKILYFSWIRERLGKSEETVTLPDNIDTVAKLLSWMKGRGEEFAAAFEFSDIVRVALDQEHAEHGDPIDAANEIAIFPPMTGG